MLTNRGSLVRGSLSFPMLIPMMRDKAKTSGQLLAREALCATTALERAWQADPYLKSLEMKLNSDVQPDSCLGPRRSVIIS